MAQDYAPVEVRVAEDSDEAAIILLYRYAEGARGEMETSALPSADLRDQLYGRTPIERYVAIRYGHLIGHGLIEDPNPDYLPEWQNGIDQINEAPS
ncbi:MAG: hypothetical protein JWN38_1092 [Candidatus Saccharibacteria bacterium]|nr:hypothetical protein [Candidatus Saccharibacteria bacterium]